MSECDQGDWSRWLKQRRNEREELGQWRSRPAVPEAPARIDLSTNDYLRLRRHPRLVAAAAQAATQWGVGTGSSRLVSGTLPLHEEVEMRFARLKSAEAGLLFVSGYQANLGVLTAIAQRGTVILADRLSHASLIDAARLAQAHGAEFRTFAHRDYARLEELIARAKKRDAHGRLAIVTDSVFSMDGDVADLARLAEIRDASGAMLIVDDAHGSGVLGPGGCGGDPNHQADVTISTASKALGSLGGIVTGRNELIDWLVNAARSFVYTTGATPVQAGVILAALDVMNDEPWRMVRLRAVSKRLRTGLRNAGFDVRNDPTPIVPIVVGEEQPVLEMQRTLALRGIAVGAIRPPTVPRGTARLRLSVHCELSDDAIDEVVGAIAQSAPAHSG